MGNPLFDALFAPHWGQKTPFLQLADGTTITYDAFLKRAAQFSNAVAQSGLVAGDRLAVQISKSPDALAIYAACIQSGVIFLPLNPAYTPGEVEYFIQDSGARLLLCDSKNQDVLGQLALANDCHLHSLDGDETGTFAKLAQGLPTTFTTVQRSSNDLTALLYTSGTTGRSKGAMLTHENLLSNARTLVDAWQFTDRDVLLNALPVFHTHGLFVATNVTLLAGGAMIFLARFDLDTIITMLPKATAMMGVPTFYTRLLGSPDFGPTQSDHMRVFISGSAPLLTETHKKFEARTGQRILERYGMTETSMNTSNPYDGERRAGTVGFPLRGVELKITDQSSGEELTTGEIGQVEIRGPNVFQGYWNMPEKTKEELREDGFFITGDLGYLEDDGYLTIVGRNKDLIISSGYNIYPKEIELVLDEQSSILESAVIGVAHPDKGEVAVAVVILEPDCVLDRTQIHTALREKLARFKCPYEIIELPKLPRNTMGKVQKNLLRDQFADLFSGG